MKPSVKKLIVRSIAFCLIFVGAILILGEEDDACITQFVVHVLLDKVIGAGLIFLAVRLLGISSLSAKSNN